MNESWDLVREFHIAFGHPVGDAPTALGPDRVLKRARWMREELDEFCDAERLDEQADAMIDLIYFALGTLVEMGVRPKTLFEIVHDANMAKMSADGVPHYAEDGKTIKPQGWRDPRESIQSELSRQVAGV
jgi:predicted HAD superfamily Cof-like phosphohydrolase